MSFQRVGDGLSGMVARWLDDPDLRWAVIERTWRRVAGEAVVRHARAVSLDAGVLEVAVDELGWINTLEGLETDLLAALIAELGDGMVEGIRWSEAWPEARFRLEE